MTSTFDRQLASRLHNLVDGLPDSPAPARALLQRGRRNRRRRTIVASAAGASCAALALGVAAAVVAQAPPPNRPAVANGQLSPRLRLAAAIDASQNISYKLRYTYQVLARPGAVLTDAERGILANYGDHGLDCVGAFDPGTTTGYLHLSHPRLGDSEERLIHGAMYSGKFDGQGHGGWLRESGTYHSLNFGVLGGALGASADPAQLLKVLRDRGSITETTPNGYHFELKLSGTGVEPALTLTGDVVANTRVERVSYEYSRSPQDGLYSGGLRELTSLELSDYGTPVTVEVPPSR